MCEFYIEGRKICEKIYTAKHEKHPFIFIVKNVNNCIHIYEHFGLYLQVSHKPYPFPFYLRMLEKEAMNKVKLGLKYFFK